MINELIEKEIERRMGGWEKMARLTCKAFSANNEEMCALCGIRPTEFRLVFKEFGQIIAKEVAMMLKFDEKEYPENGLCPCAYQTNEKADQIINEVSE